MISDDWIADARRTRLIRYYDKAVVAVVIVAATGASVAATLLLAS
ncbi:hypothetical protein GCM10010994_05770 [Chelatococcus reniformis]|uniref:Uncharacterized protein n=1 Tax=Chelatococcus reniformis TaxID=1494448 RepID=A0A916TXA1_9HYPH|nr:hypothetical protein GCM10010994_05770 [Chelatococcus reniformis]